MNNMYDEMYGDCIVCELKSYVPETSVYHRHDGYEIYLLVNGKLDYYVNTESYRLTDGHMVLMKPGEYHKANLIDTGNYQRCVLNVTVSKITSLSTELTRLEACFDDLLDFGSRVHMLKKTEVSEFVMQIRKLEQLILADSIYGKDILVNSILSNIFVAVNNYFRQKDNLQSGNAINPIVREVICFVDSHYTDCITLDDISKHISYNGTYLSRLFKQTMGISLFEYIMQRRIDTAKSLIDIGLPLTEACLDAGFCDYANFSRSFKAQMGCSPKKYQSRMRT